MNWTEVTPIHATTHDNRYRATADEVGINTFIGTGWKLAANPKQGYSPIARTNPQESRAAALAAAQQLCEEHAAPPPT